MSASNFDCRISVGLPGHPKTKKLIKIMGGDGAAWSLVKLFLWVAQHRPDGNLSGMDAEEIELAVDWAGEDGAFVAALLQVRFLDHSDDGFQVHDWREHNPFAANAEARSDAARKAAEARWNPKGKRKASGRNAKVKRTVCGSHADGMRAASKGNAPSLPSPSPSPSPVAEDQELLAPSPQADSTPVILLPLSDKSEYPITQDVIDEMAENYPAVDVLAQLRLMRGWCIGNPTKRKTRTGVMRFVTNWLADKQNNAGATNGSHRQSHSSGTSGAAGLVAQAIARRKAAAAAAGTPEAEDD